MELGHAVRHPPSFFDPHLEALPVDLAIPSRRRRFKDGSLRVDIPLQSLHLLFNVNHSIVSQVCSPPSARAL